MGFFDKLFGSKSSQDDSVKFVNQSKTVLAPLSGKVIKQEERSPMRPLHRVFWDPAAASSPPAPPFTLPLTAPSIRLPPPCTLWVSPAKTVWRS